MGPLAEPVSSRQITGGLIQAGPKLGSISEPPLGPRTTWLISGSIPKLLSGKHFTGSIFEQSFRASSPPIAVSSSGHVSWPIPVITESSASFSELAPLISGPSLASNCLSGPTDPI